MPAYRAWGEEERWYNGKRSTINPRTKTPFLGLIVVLIGPGTVSAAEDFVVALHAGGRAILVGGKTAGTTGQPLFIKLPGGGKGRICAKRDSYPDGREFVGIGVVPDVEVRPSQKSIATGKDLVVEKALATVADRVGLDTSGLIADYYAALRAQSMFTGALKRAKTEYNKLVTAYRKNDLRVLERHADNLSDLFKRELLFAYEVARLQKRFEKQGIMNERIEYAIHRGECLKREIESFFGKEVDHTEMHRVFAEIEDLSDEIHDCIRGSKHQDISKLFPELERVWTRFWKRVISRAPDLDG